MTMTATLLILPAALSDMRGQDAYRDIVQNRNGIAVGGSNPISDTSSDMITASEFEATRAGLANRAYRPARDREGSSPGAYERMTLGAPARIAASVSGMARRFGIGSTHARCDVRPVHEVQWSIPVMDGTDKARLAALDPVTTLARMTDAVVNGRIADAPTLERLHEAMIAIMSVHMGENGLASFMPATPAGPARMHACGMGAGGIVGAIATKSDWADVELDPDLARLMPSVMLVDLDERRSHDGRRSAWLRPVMTTIARFRCIDPMQALRVLHRLETEPLA